MSIFMLVQSGVGDIKNRILMGIIPGLKLPVDRYKDGKIILKIS